MRVALICSNERHVEMFAPVADALADQGATAVAVPLDPFYASGATPAAGAAGLEVVEPQSPRPAHGPGFYRRGALVVWRDVLAARTPMRAALTEIRADRLVVGNDSGLIEKLALALSRELRVPCRGLVQDGRLVASKPAAPGFRANMLRAAKRGLSPLLERAGRPYLAASSYGEGGAEVICASGPLGAELLRERAGPRARVVVTGQPRYDRLLGRERERERGAVSLVAIFTTPFAAAGLGSEAQGAQAALIAELQAALGQRGIEIEVKPHPREARDAYTGIVGAKRVCTRAGDDLLARADLAVIGASTVLEEAALVGCPVVVPGEAVHGQRLAAILPDPQVFPRFDSIADGLALIGDLEAPQAREALAERQRTVVLREVAFSASSPAAASVAAEILTG